jgi:hypothetical protein
VAGFVNVSQLSDASGASGAFAGMEQHSFDYRTSCRRDKRTSRQTLCRLEKWRFLTVAAGLVLNLAHVAIIAGISKFEEAEKQT